MSLPPGLTLYRAATRALGGLAGPALTRRARAGKEDKARLGERLGRAGQPRPAGPLVWIHAASVGESLVALTLAETLQARRPGLGVLITSGTRTSARLIGERVRPGLLHQFPPIDRIDAVERFLDHWQPDLAVFTESELWPNLILETARRGTPMALVNARMNERSLQSWRRWPDTARWLLSCFDWIGPADLRTAQGLSALLGTPLEPVGNLKLDAGFTPPDADALDCVRRTVGARPVWVAASTHEGEDEVLLAAHAEILHQTPDALLILAPRHPERGPAIGELIGRAGLTAARRSAGETPSPDTAVWLTDTLGEMALWFTAAPVAFIAGSLLPGIGGHNPLEATRAGAQVVTGPHTASFDDVFAAYREAGAVETAGTPETIARAIEQAWTRGDEARAAGEAALAALAGQSLDVTLGALLPLLAEESD